MRLLLASTLLLLASPAQAQAPAIEATTPRSERDVTNIDVVRQQIRNYYGDPLGKGVISEDSPYAREVAAVERRIGRWLDRAKRRVPEGKTPAIVLDVDDTCLLRWNFELATNFAFDPAKDGEWVTAQKFPAVPGMKALLDEAAADGYAVVYVTGRGASQEQATLGNLGHDGTGEDADLPGPTPVGDEDGLFTSPAPKDYPDYLRAACAGDPGGKCTRAHYKAATRAHVEQAGFVIVANVGDQRSDLDGGHALRTFKLPNPTYFLP